MLGKKSLWVLLLAVALVMALVPTALADGNHSPSECLMAGDSGDLEVQEYTINADDGFVIDKICIKSGDGAFGDLQHSGVITTDGSYGTGNAFTVTGLGTSSVTVKSIGKDISHIDYNQVEKPKPKGEVEVKKTAKLTYDKEHKWDISKNAVWKKDGSDVVNPVLLPADGSGDGYIKWLVDVTYEGFAYTNVLVTGKIFIKNVGDLKATVESIEDVLDTGEVGDVTCDEYLPFDIEPDDYVTCTYVVDDLDYPADGKNKVTVKGEFSDYTSFEEHAKAYFEDMGPSNQINKTINVADWSSYFGYQSLGTVTAPYDGHFKYHEEFTYEGVGNCEELEIVNKAFIKETDQKAYEKVVIKTECLVFKGETATGDGKPWSEVNKAPNTWFEFSPFAKTDRDIVTGRKLSDIGDFSYTNLAGPTSQLCFELDDPWELADVAGNVKIQPLNGYPTAYLAPGKFAVHATVDPDDSESFCVTVPDATYGYAIHLDVGKWVSIGFGDLA